MTKPKAILTEVDFLDSLKEIFNAGAQLLKLEEELNELFPERSFLIRQMVLAVLSRMNVLMYGPYGTGKSKLIREFINALGAKDDNLFSIELTRYTTESDVFGPIDVRALREDGSQRRNPEGSIRTALFADVGEIFDAPGLLRSMLGIFNERIYVRGVDTGPVPLHTAFASTNVDPVELLKKFPDTAAVVDRFLFQTEVSWLEEDDSLWDMLNNFQGGKTPKTTVDLNGLLTASKMVEAATDQIREELMDPIYKIIKALREKWRASSSWRKFSDRVFCQWMTVLEANAVLHGRYDVALEDLYSLKYVVCNGGDQAQLDAFDQIANPIIEKAIEARNAMSVDQAVTMLIESIRDEWPAEPAASITAEEMVAMRRKFREFQEKANAMKPEQPSTEKDVQKLRSDISSRIAQLDNLFAGV